MNPRAKSTTGASDDPVSRAGRVGEVITGALSRIEEVRELPADVLAALHRERLFRVLLPKSLGGDEADLVTFARMIGTIAAVDASTAWCLSQGGGCAMASAFLEPKVAKRFFGAPDAVLAWGAGIQGKARKIEGGYRVTGTWTFASGSRHATLLGAHSYVLDADGTPLRRPDGRPLDRTALFARSKAKIMDVWHVVGLKGTGSDSYSVEDLFVPEEETIERESPAELRESGPLYKFAATLAYGVGFSALMLGIGRGILDDLTRLAMVKTPRAASMSLRDNPVFQTQLSQLEARHRSLVAYLHTTAGNLFETVSRTGEMTLAQRVELKLATTYCINAGVEIVTEAYRAAGNTAIFPANPFERRMRDALTASQQTQGRGTNYVTCGRCMLGLDPDSTAFMV